jgi:hydrogenase maturation protein HypF
VNNDECYPFSITPVTRSDGGIERIIRLEEMITALLTDTHTAVIAAKFHNTLTAMLIDIAQQVGEPKVVLSGGCFHNRALLERSVKALRRAGFTPFWQQLLPPNDGGIALGQIMAALREVHHVSGRARENNQHPG